MRRWLLAIVAVASALAFAFACVPADTRPTPGTLTLTVSPSTAVANGVMTTDGWQVVFERVLVGIGDGSLSDQCTVYGEANYDRLLDVTHDAGQKLGILHGIGQCDLRFRVSAPSSDAILGEGVAQSDADRLRARAGDAYVPLGGVAVELTGTATRAGVTKHFTISFRPRIRYGGCGLVPDAGVPAVDLESNVDLVYDIAIEAEAMLRTDVDAAAPLRFDPFAQADVDGDGIVTLDELRGVPIESVRDGGPFEAGTFDYDEDAGVIRRGRPLVIVSFGDYVYELLLPTLARFRDNGFCVVSSQQRPAND
ncbi:MAG TPA: hypothetical protein VIF62_07735 [Labilithrix sp.]|jgi:hypothetical protein